VRGDSDGGSDQEVNHCLPRWGQPANDDLGSGHVLRDESQPMHVGMVSRGWGAARDAAGISYRLHDLRHFYASGLIRAGCDVVTVQRALGHASATTTLATYSHLWSDADDRTRRAAGELLDAALGGSADAAADALRTQ
jgi:integrase